MRLSDGELADLRARNPVAPVAERLGAVLRRIGSQGGRWFGSCPVCGGGATAQRFEVKTDEAWVCAVCADGGDVIRLVEKALGTDFRAAVEWLGGAAKLSPEDEARLAKERAAKKARAEAANARYREEERTRLFKMWRAAVARADLLGAYLDCRGLEAGRLFGKGVCLKLGAAVPFFHGQVEDGRGRKSARMIHRGPAMLAPILAPNGVFTGLHITWLRPDGRGKAVIADPDTGEIIDPKKMRGSVLAGRIELFQRAFEPRALTMGEGIETVLTAALADDFPQKHAYWSALDLGNLGGRATETLPHPSLKMRNHHPVRVPGPDHDLAAPGIPIPPTVTGLTLLGDGDSDAFTTRHAMTRGARRYRRPGLVIRHAWAPAGHDLNDLVRPVEDGEGAE